MKLDSKQKSGLIQLIAFVIGNRTNEEATDLSYMELLDLKNTLRQDEEEEPEVAEVKYILSEDGILKVGSHGVTLNDKIRNQELHEYSIAEVDDITSNLMRWIAEGNNDSGMMRQDLEMLIKCGERYVLTSNSTNSYLIQGDSEFDETCEELMELNNNLK